jgi:hypothetical protein
MLSSFNIRPPQMSKYSLSITMASNILSIIKIFKAETVTTVTEVGISGIT